MVEAQHRFHVARLLSFNVLLSIVQVNEGVQAHFLVMRVNYTCKLSSIKHVRQFLCIWLYKCVMFPDAVQWACPPRFCHWEFLFIIVCWLVEKLFIHIAAVKVDCFLINFFSIFVWGFRSSCVKHNIAQEFHEDKHLPLTNLWTKKETICLYLWCFCYL